MSQQQAPGNNEFPEDSVEGKTFTLSDDVKEVVLTNGVKYRGELKVGRSF